jgi:hypothetical protein
MSTIVWPSTITPAAADFGIEYDVQLAVMRSGKVYTYGLPGARWTATITFRNDTKDALRGLVEALVASLRGGARRLSMPHFGRPVPNGTLRGSPTLSSPTTVGANTLPLANCNGGVKAGDILGLGTQLLMAEEDANPSSGNMTVKISPCVRAVYSAGTAVTWNRPTCLWIPKSSVAGPFPYLPGVRPSFSLELVEAG